VVAIDGAGLDHVTRGGVGSRRYRVSFKVRAGTATAPSDW